MVEIMKIKCRWFRLFSLVAWRPSDFVLLSNGVFCLCLCVCVCVCHCLLVMLMSLIQSMQLHCNMEACWLCVAIKWELISQWIEPLHQLHWFDHHGHGEWRWWWWWWRREGKTTSNEIFNFWTYVSDRYLWENLNENIRRENVGWLNLLRFLRFFQVVRNFLMVDLLWLVTKCYRRYERDLAEWEIHKGSRKDLKPLTLFNRRYHFTKRSYDKLKFF